MLDPKKIIIKSIAQAKNMSEEAVQKELEKQQNSKKKKKKENALEIIDATGSTVDFKNIEGRVPNKIDLKKDVLAWTLRDVTLYLRSKIEGKMQSHWKCRIPGVVVEMGRLFDTVSEIHGHADSLILKDYIDFFFEYKIDNVLNRTSYFTPVYLRNKDYIADFCMKYDYRQRFMEYIQSKQTSVKSKENNVSYGDIDKVFALSEDLFVKKYGIIICIYWLKKHKKYTHAEACNRVLQICTGLHKKKEFNDVKKITESFSPYYKDLKFSKLDFFVQLIDKRFKIEVEYMDTQVIKNKFSFLEEKNDR